MKSLIRTNLALAVVILVPAATLAAGAAESSVTSAGCCVPRANVRGPAEHTIAQSRRLVRVIVTLKGLEAGPAWAERIARARERVMLALKDHHVEVNREYDLIPALALTVDDEALNILRAHPDVSDVTEDQVSRPGNK